MSDDLDLHADDSARTKGSAPAPADIWVGNRVRQRRLELGLSLVRLAEDMGISKNQLMKFENGENRLTCGRLWDIANSLSTSVDWFYDKMPGARTLTKPHEDIMDLLASGNAIDVLRLYNRLTPEQGRALRTLMENLVAGNEAIADVAQAHDETMDAHAA